VLLFGEHLTKVWRLFLHVSLPGKLIFDKKYSNDDYASLLEVIQLFLKESKTTAKPTTACLAVAGPVANNQAKLTNRSSWVIDGQALGKELGLERTRVINDFVAMGYGLLTLNEEKECVVLQRAPKQRDAPIACIGAGTGLGECFITPNGMGGYECYGSEGGHAEFAPRNDVSSELITSSTMLAMHYMWRIYKYVCLLCLFNDPLFYWMQN